MNGMEREKTIETPIGPLRLVASETALIRIEFPTSTSAAASTVNERTASATGAAATTTASPPHAVLDRAERELAEYFAGRRKRFDVPLDPRGTPFETSVWRALVAIPFGETRSYADIARAVGNARAVRAVGGANHRNPLAIIVPCHRVIGANGTLTGYGGGLPTKRWLLDHEGATYAGAPSPKQLSIDEPSLDQPSIA